MALTGTAELGLNSIRVPLLRNDTCLGKVSGVEISEQEVDTGVT